MRSVGAEAKVGNEFSGGDCEPGCQRAQARCKSRLGGSRNRPGSSVDLLLWILVTGDDGTGAMRLEDVGRRW